MRNDKKAHTPHFFTIHPSLGRLVLAIVVITGATVGFMFRVPLARAYSCSLHCYGKDMQTSLPNLHGATTRIQVMHLSCTYSACHCSTTHNACSIDNELWLEDTSHNYWVEAGYTTDSTGSSTIEDYFWCDSKPSHPNTSCYPLSQVPSGDYFYYTNVTISGYTGNSYDINILSNNIIYNLQSASNTMTPDTVEFGQELSGTSGASAPNALFIYNGYLDNVRNIHYFPTDGKKVESDAPDLAFWYEHPSQDSTGGKFETSCCSGNAAPAISPQPEITNPPASGPLLPMRPVGAPAIAPHPDASGNARFLETDARAYVMSHSLWHATSSTTNSVDDVRFLSAQAVSTLLNGTSTGQPDAAPLCYVQTQGDYQFASPDGSTIVYHTGYEVFDATTGNLLMAGALG